MKLLNCVPTQPLGFPAYYRAIYARWPIVESAQLGKAVAKIAARMLDSELALPINDPTPVASSHSTELRVQVYEGAQAVTVAHLANELEPPAVAWGLIPDLGIDFVSLERISAEEAHDEAANRAAVDKQDADPLASLEHILELVLALVVIGLIVWGVLKLRGVLKNV